MAVLSHHNYNETLFLSSPCGHLLSLSSEVRQSDALASPPPSPTSSTFCVTTASTGLRCRRGAWIYRSLGPRLSRWREGTQTSWFHLGLVWGLGQLDGSRRCSNGCWDGREDTDRWTPLSRSFSHVATTWLETMGDDHRKLHSDTGSTPRHTNDTMTISIKTRYIVHSISKQKTRKRQSK